MKNDEKIRVVGKAARYNIYTYNQPYEFETHHSLVNALEYDLSYLLNLMEMKMTLKEGEELSPTDLIILRRIQDRIADKKEDVSKGVEILKEYLQFERGYKHEIDERINKLEARIEKFLPKELIQCPMCHAIGSVKIVKDKKKILSYVEGEPIYAKKYRCIACGCEF